MALAAAKKGQINPKLPTSDHNAPLPGEALSSTHDDILWKEKEQKYQFRTRAAKEKEILRLSTEIASPRIASFLNPLFFENWPDRLLQPVGVV
jgi:hypothetical protein